jgi:hypothetical protein
MQYVFDVLGGRRLVVDAENMTEAENSARASLAIILDPQKARICPLTISVEEMDEPELDRRTLERRQMAANPKAAIPPPMNVPAPSPVTAISEPQPVPKAALGFAIPPPPPSLAELKSRKGPGRPC